MANPYETPICVICGIDPPNPCIPALMVLLALRLSPARGDVNVAGNDQQILAGTLYART